MKMALRTSPLPLFTHYLPNLSRLQIAAAAAAQNSKSLFRSRSQTVHKTVLVCLRPEEMFQRTTGPTIGLEAGGRRMLVGIIDKAKKGGAKI